MLIQKKDENLKEIKKKLYILILFLLSLLFHLFLLKKLFEQQKEDYLNNQYKVDQTIVDEEQKSLQEDKPNETYLDEPNIEEEQWAKEKHTYGLPVFLYDQKDDTTSQQVTLPQEDDSQTESQIIDSKVIDNIITDNIPEKVETVERDSTFNEDAKISEQVPLNTEKDTTIKKQENIESIPNNLEKITQPQTQVKKQRRKILSDKPKPIIKDFFKNFDKGFSTNKNDGIDIFGPSNSGLENVKELCYQQKINENLAKSFKIVGFKKEIKIPQTDNAKVHSGMRATIKVNIDKKGNVISTESKCSIKPIENFFIEVINYAAPFPPIPKHLNVDMYTYDIYINISPYAMHDPYGPRLIN